MMDEIMKMLIRNEIDAERQYRKTKNKNKRNFIIYCCIYLIAVLAIIVLGIK